MEQVPIQPSPESLSQASIQSNVQIAIPLAPKKKSKKWLIIILFLFFLTSSGVAGYFFYLDSQLKKESFELQSPQPQSLPVLSEPSPSPLKIEPSSASPSASLNSSIILKIALIDYEIPENIIGGGSIKEYQDKIIKVGEEFIIGPETAISGFEYKRQVGDIKLKLIEVKENSILIDILEDKLWDDSFYPRERIERKEIVDATCLEGVPLVTDSEFKYCFTLSKDKEQLSLAYSITGRSTMPPPP